MSAFGGTLTPRPRGKGKLVWEENWIRKVKREVSTGNRFLTVAAPIRAVTVK